MNQKGFANIAIIILVVAIAGAIGYFTLVKMQAPPNNVDDCNFISDSSFRSINQYEGGLGPNGPVMGYWRIVFQGNKVTWTHSDIVENGTYTCKNNILQVKLGSSLTANYDRNKQVLIWDDIQYKKVETGK